MKLSYKVLSASAVSALATVPVLAAPAFAADVSFGQANFETLESVSVEDLGIIQSQGSQHRLYNSYFDENDNLFEAPTTVEINGEAVDYQQLMTQLEQTGAANVNEYIEQGGELPAAGQQAALNTINAGEGTLEDYETSGIVRVTEDNIETVNNAVIESEGGALSAAEIQGVVDEVVNALIRINAGEGTLTDYRTIDTYGVYESNFELLNNNVVNAKQSQGEALTAEEIQEVAEPLRFQIRHIHARNQ